jgi:mannose-6-phosphate isomerase-like protein (cupin superfamily)
MEAGMSETDTYHLFGVVVRILATNAETGAYCLCEGLVAPGAGAPPNRHAGEDESFYVLEGTFAFTIDGELREAGTGAFVKIPDGAVHAFKNTGAVPGRILIMNAPGLIHEAFFSRVGEPLPRGSWDFPVAEGAPDIPRLIAIAREAGVEILPPPAAA